MSSLGFLVLGAVVVGLASICLLISQRRSEQRRASRFADREQLSIDEFWSRFYGDTGVPVRVVDEVLRTIAGAIEVPIGKLRPDDRFDGGLAPEKGWEFSDGLAEVEWWLQAKAKRQRQAVDVSGIQTVDDLIRLTHDLTAQGGG